ncbi:MAG: hypothetical protein RRA92_08545 [Gemmatimonadota bacterium]|nr:hypothetical protein [Gemmatimonadota bacterium]
MRDWTRFRIRGERGAPALEYVQFLACLSAIRPALAGVRWHLRWSSSERGGAIDGLRVELPFDGPARSRVAAELERRIPPPDGILAEPLRTDTDLDPLQDEVELDRCLDVLWRWSELLVELRARNPGALSRQFQALTPGALLTFVTRDRRHIERAVEGEGLGTVPAVSFSRLADLLGPLDLVYRLPPLTRIESVHAARVHHLAACTMAGEFYPFTRSR